MIDTYPLVLWRCSFLEGTQSPAAGLVECLHSPSRDELLKTATKKTPLKNSCSIEILSSKLGTEEKKGASEKIRVIN